MDAVEVRLFNTAARAVVPVALDREREVRIYTCGPTVYRPVHLGNLRSYLLADWLKRLLLAQGYQVRHVKNITDVGHMRQELLDRGEDKIVAEALSAGISAAEIARRYTDEFLRDEQCIGILPATEFPRATDHVSRMVEIAAELITRGYAYERGGNVYFRVAAFEGYGELGGSVSREGLRQGVRAEADPLKEDARDFALWKAAEAGRTELVWPSPWGAGFPGWHIECTAMSTQHLGPQLDIHTGGVDNVFPHHEDERAQSEALTGVRPFARVWLHGQHLLADGLKMAKSTGNAYTLSDLLALDFEPLAFRYLCLTAHYRARLNFTFTSLRAAQAGLYRLRKQTSAWSAASAGAEAGGQAAAGAAATPRSHASGAGSARAGTDAARAGDDTHAAALSPEAQAARERFWQLAASDLALPTCLAMAWSLVRGPLASLPVAEKATLARDFDRLLGLELATPPPRRAADPFRAAVSSPRSVPDAAASPDACTLSVVVVVQPDEDRAAVQRCVRSVLATTGGHDLEVVLVDATGVPTAHAELSSLLDQPRVRLAWIDHDPGAAGARNLGLRLAQGRFVALMDPSVEVTGDVWSTLLAALEDASVGAVGPFGLLTADMRHYFEVDTPAADDPHAAHDHHPSHRADGHDPADRGQHARGSVREVDALQNYLMVFRRADLPRIGPLDEHFRFYRILDLDLSYAIRDRVGRLLSFNDLPLVRHRHALWESLSEGDREERSRKNFGRFLKRWDHRHDLRRIGESAELVGHAALHG